MNCAFDRHSIIIDIFSAVEYYKGSQIKAGGVHAEQGESPGGTSSRDFLAFMAILPLTYFLNRCNMNVAKEINSPLDKTKTPGVPALGVFLLVLVSSSVLAVAAYLSPSGHLHM